MDDQVVIGIGGVSRAGKGTLASSIAKYLTTHGVPAKNLSMDDYVRPLSEIPTIRDRTDWEDPDSIKWDRLLLEIANTHEKVILVEGIFVTDQRLKSLWYKKILVQVDQEIFHFRRSTESRWGPEPEWYRHHVWKTNTLLNDPDMFDVVIDGNRSYGIDELIGKLSLDELFH